MPKTFQLNITINEFDSPQAWKFSEDCNGLEKLAIWQIVEFLAKKQQGLMLGSNPKFN